MRNKDEITNAGSVGYFGTDLWSVGYFLVGQAQG